MTDDTDCPFGEVFEGESKPEKKTCDFPECEYFPHYGVAPHNHGNQGASEFIFKAGWPSNFEVDPETDEGGTYHCPGCGDRFSEGKSIMICKGCGKKMKSEIDEIDYLSCKRWCGNKNCKMHDLVFVE